MDFLSITTPIYQPTPAYDPEDTPVHPELRYEDTPGPFKRETLDISTDSSLSAYQNEIYAHLNELQDVWCPSIRREYQTPSRRAHRRNLCVNWMTRVAVDTGASLHAIHLAISYFDVVFSRNLKFPSQKHQLLISTCLFTATKQVDTTKMWISEYLDYVQEANTFTVRDVLNMEAYLLSVLNWKLELPSAYAFLQLYVNAVRGTRMSTDRFESLAGYLINCTLILGKGLPNKSPSMVAHAACLLAWASLGMDVAVERTLMQLGPHDEFALDLCVEELRAYVHLKRDAWVADTVQSANTIMNSSIPTDCIVTKLYLRRTARQILRHAPDLVSIVSLIQDKPSTHQYFDFVSSHMNSLDVIHTNHAFDRPAPMFIPLVWMKPSTWRITKACLTPSPTFTRASQNNTTPMTGGKRPNPSYVFASKRRQPCERGYKDTY